MRRSQLVRALFLLAFAPLVACGEGAPSLQDATEVQPSAQALTTEITLEPVADTRVSNYDPVTNFGSDDNLKVAGVLFDTTKMSMVRFDETAIVAAVGSGALESATLEVAIDTVGFGWGDNDLALHRMTMAWTESGATWLCANDTDHGFFGRFQNNCSLSDRWGLEFWSLWPQPYDSTPTDSVPLSWNQTGAVSLDVTADVQAVLDGTSPHHGWLLSNDPGVSSIWARFHSRDSANPPKLVLSVADLCDPVGSDDNCDGADDDCDDAVDEAYVSTATSCGVGVCVSTGTLTCVDGSELDSCLPGPTTGTDMDCDGLDDDCDGAADEAYASTATNCGTGVCASTGTLTCVDGSEQDSCMPGPATGTDVLCDGVDDDCDGAADESYAPVPITCGQGVCLANSATVCVAGSVQQPCTPGPTTGDDMDCDGVDQDCDGTSDEGFVGTMTSCGEHGCAATGMTSCVDAAIVDSCTPGTPAADDATCDGVDGDCDGSVDEDFVDGCDGTQIVTCNSGVPNIVECDDADLCNGEETCQASACVGGIPPRVNDGNACTEDICLPSVGVIHTPLPGQPCPFPFGGVCTETGECVLP
ncbi:MAG: DNRLRE domain-containing protein [Myxococcales bacterium]|nr:DNRLRE domain-containing protein [Myxococcales bacterium]